MRYYVVIVYSRFGKQAMAAIDSSHDTIEQAEGAKVMVLSDVQDYTKDYHPMNWNCDSAKVYLRASESGDVL